MSKTNVIKFVTDDAYIHDYRPMAPSLKYAPEWWKKLPRHFVSQDEAHPVVNPSMKGCPGFIDLYKNSFALPVDCEIELSEFILDDNKVALRWWPEHAGSIHPDVQTGNAFSDRYHHFKVSCRYSFATESSDNFLITNNFWGDRLNIHVLNGVMPSTKNALPLRINMYIPKGFGYLKFNYGDIIAHAIPLSGKKYVVEKKLMMGDEYVKYHRYHQVLARTRLDATKIRREISDDTA